MTFVPPKNRRSHGGEHRGQYRHKGQAKSQPSNLEHRIEVLELVEPFVDL